MAFDVNNNWFDNPLTRRKTTTNTPKVKTSKTKTQTTGYPIDEQAAGITTDSNGWKSAPDYYIDDGKGNRIRNPRYNSSRASSAAAGGAYGASIRTGNPLFDTGAILGGVLRGAIDKNVGRNAKYAADEQYVDTANAQTQAYQRFLAQKEQITQSQLQQQKIQHQMDYQDTLARLRQTSVDRKKLTELQNSLGKLETNSPQREALSDYINEKAKEFYGESAPAIVNPNTGEKNTHASIGGNEVYFDKEGNYVGAVVDQDTGHVLSDMSPEKYIKILKDMHSLAPKIPIDEALIKKAKGLAIASGSVGKRLSIDTINIAKQLASAEGGDTIQIPNGDGSFREITTKDIPVPDAITTGQPSTYDDTKINGGNSDVTLMPVPKQDVERIQMAKSPQELQDMLKNISSAPDSPAKNGVVQMINNRLTNEFHVKPMLPPTLKTEPASKPTSIKLSPTTMDIPDYDTTGMKPNKTVINHKGKKYVWIGGTSYREIQ